MSIESFDADDIKQFKSGATGDFLGGAIHGDEVSDATVNAVFRIITEDEAEIGTTLYRCAYIKNAHSTDYIRNPILMIASDTSSPNDWVAIGWGTATVGQSEQTIADEHTAPVGIAFKTGNTRSTGAILGRDIPPGSYKAVWFRVKVENGANPLLYNRFEIFIDTDNKEGAAPPLSGPGDPDKLRIITVGEMECNTDFANLISKIKRRSPHRFVANSNMTTKDSNECFLSHLEGGSRGGGWRSRGGGTGDSHYNAPPSTVSASAGSAFATAGGSYAFASAGGVVAQAGVKSGGTTQQYSISKGIRNMNAKRPVALRNITYITFGKQDVRTESLRNSYINAFSDHKTGVGIDPGYYSRNVYNMHLIFMDTSGYNDYGAGSDQYYWVEQDLQEAEINPNIKWIILFSHRAMYASNTSTNVRFLDEIFRDTYHQLFATYNVHVVIQSYFQNYQRMHLLEYNPTTPEEPALYQSGSAPDYTFVGKGFPNASLFIVAGTGGQGHDNFSPAEPYMLKGDAIDYGYLMLELDLENDPDKLLGKWYNHKDELKDNWSMTRTG